MPRDGSGVYTLPFPDVVTNTTIASTVYNGFEHDVATDLNAPRPIVAGGTGATSASAALAALQGEMFGQVVTNYDSMVFQPGSFYSASTATAEPVDGHAFVGSCYYVDANNMYLEAFDRDDTSQPAAVWIRQKKAGVWSSWAKGQALNIVGTPVANQFTTWQSATALQGIAITGLVKGNGASAPSAAVAGTDYSTVAVANPGSQKVGITAVNGSAATAMRSDGAPALDLTISPTWTGTHTFNVSVVLGGTPTAPTAAAGTNTTQIATTAFVASEAVRYDAAQGLSTAQKAQVQSNISIPPTTQVFTTGSGTYTTPANVKWIAIELVGGGGGGGGSGTSPGATGAGGNTTFGPLTGNGGAGASTVTGGAGGTASGGFVNKTGVQGGNGSGANQTPGGAGGNSPMGGGGPSGAAGGGTGGPAVSNSGSGGGGGGMITTINGGGGGGAGGFVRAIIASPAATYSYAVGAGGTAGTAGTGGIAGGAGGSGFIQVTEFYS